MDSGSFADEQVALTLSQLSWRIKTLRKDRGFRLSDLATLTGFSEAYLYRVEEGERSPSLPALIRLSKAYDVPISELLQETETEQLRVQHAGTAVWHGTESAGNGLMIGSDGEQMPYDVESRLSETKDGFSSPEEHIGIAIAGCFSMSLAQRLEEAGFECQHIETTASVRLSSSAKLLEVSKITLYSEVDVDGINDEKLEEIAQHTRKTCVIARALAAVPVSLHLTRSGETPLD